jgi:hypothetical protein
MGIARSCVPIMPVMPLVHMLRIPFIPRIGAMPFPPTGFHATKRIVLTPDQSGGGQ